MRIEAALFLNRRRVPQSDFQFALFNLRIDGNHASLSIRLKRVP